MLFFSFKENPTFIGVTVPGEICGKIATGGVALVCNYEQVCSDYSHVPKFPKYFKAWVNILLSLFIL